MPYKDPEQARLRQRRYYHKHKDYLLAQGRSRGKLWYAKNHLEVQAARKAHVTFSSTKEVASLNIETSYERYRRRQRELYAQDSSKRREYGRRWQKAHRDPTINARRRARVKDLPATLTKSQWVAIKVAYRFRCAYCDKRLDALTQDHVIPLSKGGGTTPENIVPACRSCNSRKSNRLISNPPAVRLFL